MAVFNKLKSAMFVSAFTMVSVAEVQAVPVVISDNYIGGQATNAQFNTVDVIGDVAKFDVQSLQVEISNQILSVGITTSYFDNAGIYGTTFGDVFISSNGWNPVGSAPYLQDTASNGETWEYALVFDNHGEQFAQSGQAGSMIGATGSVSLVALNSAADIELSHSDSNGDHRANQEVSVKNPNLLSTISLGTWSIADGANGYSNLNLSISLANLPQLLAADALGFHFGFSCGNDVIEGAYSVPNSSTEVPEPSTVVLLLSGVAGALKRRRATSAL